MASSGDFPGAPSRVTRQALPLHRISHYLASTNMVKIYVGPDRELFILHEEILCDRVNYFRAAFRGQFIEGQEKTIDLPEDNPTAFTHVIDWIYGHNLTLEDCPDNSVCKPDHFMQLCQIFVIADKFCMEELAKNALDSFSGKTSWYSFRWTPRKEEVLYVYQNTHDESPLRSLLVTEMVRRFFLDSPPFVVADWELIKTCEPNFSNDITEAIRAHILIQTSTNSDGDADDGDADDADANDADADDDSCVFERCILHGGLWLDGWP